MASREAPEALKAEAGIQEEGVNRGMLRRGRGLV